MDNLKIKTLSKEIKLPSNIEAEQALIGSILVNNDIVDEIASIINNKEFYVVLIYKPLTQLLLATQILFYKFFLHTH